MARRPLTPADLDPLDAAAAPIPPDDLRGDPRRPRGRPSLDPRDVPLSPAELRAMGLFGQREPGVSGVDGTPVDPGQPLLTQRDAGGYTYRAPITDTEREFMRRGMLDPVDPTASHRPSQRDMDMESRGFAPVYGPRGDVAYQVAAPDHDDAPSQVPGAPGRKGRRYDLEGPMITEDGRLVEDATGAAVPKFESTAVQGPTGQQYVYSPSDQAVRRQRAYETERRLVRQAQAANMPIEEFRNKHAAEFADIEMGGIRSGAGARLTVEEARRKEAQSIRDRLKAVGILTGGRPSWGPGGSGTVANQYLDMPQEWRNAVMAQNLAPGLDGTTPLTAEAQSAKNALRLLSAEMLGGLLGAGGPLAQTRAEQERRANRTAREDDLGDIYAPAGMLGYDEFTPDEQQQMYDDLVAEGHSDLEAKAAVSRQAQKRRASVRRFGSVGTPPGAAAPVPPPPAAGADPAAGVAAAIL